MFNLTGMINTDLLILKTIKGTYKVKKKKTVWKNILIKEKYQNNFLIFIIF